MGWKAQDPTCQKFTSRGPFKGNVTQQGPGGQNGAKWRPKGCASTKNMLTGTPKHSFFGPKHILDALEWVGRPHDPTCQNFTSQGPFKGDGWGPKWGKMGSKNLRVH